MAASFKAFTECLSILNHSDIGKYHFGDSAWSAKRYAIEIPPISQHFLQWKMKGVETIRFSLLSQHAMTLINGKISKIRLNIVSLLPAAVCANEFGVTLSFQSEQWIDKDLDTDVLFADVYDQAQGKGMGAPNWQLTYGTRQKVELSSSLKFVALLDIGPYVEHKIPSSAAICAASQTRGNEHAFLFPTTLKARRGRVKARVLHKSYQMHHWKQLLCICTPMCWLSQVRETSMSFSNMAWDFKDDDTNPLKSKGDERISELNLTKCISICCTQLLNPDQCAYGIDASGINQNSKVFGGKPLLYN